MDLVTPAGEVAEGLDGHAHVGLQGQSVNGPGVDGFDGGQLLLVLLHQVSQPVCGGEEGGVFSLLDIYNNVPNGLLSHQTIKSISLLISFECFETGIGYMVAKNVVRELDDVVVMSPIGSWACFLIDRQAN